MLYVEPACDERNTVAATSLWCMCVCSSVRPSGFVGTKTSILIDGFQNNLAQLLFVMGRISFRKFQSGSMLIWVSVCVRICPDHNFYMYVYVLTSNY